MAPPERPTDHGWALADRRLVLAMAKRLIEDQEGQRVMRVYTGRVIAGKRVRVETPGGHIEVGGRTPTEARRLAEAFLTERDGEPCRVEMQRHVSAGPSADASTLSAESWPLGVPREGIGTRGEALFLAAVKGHDVDPAAVWWPMPPVGRGVSYRYIECAWCLKTVIERDTPDGVRYAGVALALRCRQQSTVHDYGADSGGSTAVPMDLGTERTLGMRSATRRDGDTTRAGRGSDRDGRGEGTTMRAMGLSYATLANRRRGLRLAGNGSGLRADMAVTRPCASCGKGVLPYERVEVGGALFCGWCAGLVEAPAFDAAAGGSGDAGAATGEVV